MASVRGGQSWRNRHLKDPYVKAAQSSGYRARSAYKLLEIQQSQKLIKPGMQVCDLGAAPGGWTQVAAEVGAKVTAVDLLPMTPVKDAVVFQGDFLDPAVQAQLLPCNNDRFDVCISDMAPNISGDNVRDMAACLELYENVLIFLDEALKPGGSLLIKVFAGRGIEQFQQALKGKFTKIRAIKPKSSRKTSREYYILAQGYNLR